MVCVSSPMVGCRQSLASCLQSVGSKLSSCGDAVKKCFSGLKERVSSCYEGAKSCASQACETLASCSSECFDYSWGACKWVGTQAFRAIQFTDDKIFKFRPSLVHMFKADSRVEKLLGFVQGVRGLTLLGAGSEVIAQLSKGSSVQDIATGEVEEDINPSASQLIQASVIFTAFLETAAFLTLLKLRRNPSEVVHAHWPLRRVAGENQGRIIEALGQAQSPKLNMVLDEFLGSSIFFMGTGIAFAGMNMDGGRQVIVLIGASSNAALKAIRHCVIDQQLKQINNESALRPIEAVPRRIQIRAGQMSVSPGAFQSIALSTASPARTSSTTSSPETVSPDHLIDICRPASVPPLWRPTLETLQAGYSLSPFPPYEGLMSPRSADRLLQSPSPPLELLDVEEDEER